MPITTSDLIGLYGNASYEHSAREHKHRERNGRPCTAEEARAVIRDHAEASGLYFSRPITYTLKRGRVVHARTGQGKPLQFYLSDALARHKRLFKRGQVLAG